MDDFESFTRAKIANLRTEADALEKILKEFQATKARLAGAARRSGGDQPRAGAFGAVMEAIIAAGPQGLTLDEMMQAAGAEGYEIKRGTLRSQVWKSKEDGALTQMEQGRYRYAAHDIFGGVRVDAPTPEEVQEVYSGGGFQPAGGRPQSTGPRESFSADLDDEIPF
jgi:hypothetical protein